LVFLSVKVLLDRAVELGASDLHLCHGDRPLFRVRGELSRDETFDRLSPEDTRAMLYEIMSPEQQVSFEANWEMDFSFTHVDPRGVSHRCRVNVYMDRGGVSAAIRVLPSSIRGIEELGLPSKLKEVAMRHSGLFLVTGPTGSGKSTTLAAMVEHVNRNRACHIVTIEDPIEYLFSSKKSVINQREVGSDTRSFAEALRRVLRQDPDVIMVGEMRDLETIAAAITAAETGHLVLATLHTPDAPQSVDRVVDVFPPSQQQQIKVQLSNVLLGVCAQRLVPSADGRDRVLVTELMIGTPAVRNLIREGKTYQLYNVIQTGQEQGMHTMDQCLARLLQEGRISLEVARSMARDPDRFYRGIL